MTYVALLVALVALLVVWRSNRAVKDLKERHAQLNSRLYDLRVEMDSAVKAQQKAIAGLKFDLMRQAGRLQVTGDMTVDEVTMLHPQVPAVLAGFHIGGCTSCAVDGSTRLEEAMARSGGHLEPLLVALNELVMEGADGRMPEGRLRAPNVQLVL
jgi:hypothetical protein